MSREQLTLYSVKGRHDSFFWKRKRVYMDAFEVFKIIIGLVIGIFFLYFMLNFSGIYSTYQQESIEVTHMKNFRTALQNVYVTDTPLVFKLKIDTEYNPPDITLLSESLGFPGINVPVPFFYKSTKKDQDVIAYRESIGEGFSKFKFVGVFPETNIFFNIVPFKNDSYQIIKELAELLPPSEDPSVIYGFCFNDDDYTIYQQPSKSSFISEMNQIIKYTSAINPNWQPQNKKIDLCAKQRAKNDMLIIVSDQERMPEYGFLIKPKALGAGEVFYKEDGAPKIFAYKDALDILAIITGGEEGYNYKNEEQLKFLEISTRSEIERMSTLSFEYQNSKPDCSSLFEDTKNYLKKLQASVQNLKTKFNSLPNAVQYSIANEEVKKKYTELEAKECL